MTDSSDPWHGPPRSWELTAPESFVLRYAPTTRVGAEAFKLALQELVVRGALRLRPVRVPRVLGLGGRNRWLITEGPMFGGCTESALVPVLEVYRSTPHRRLQVAAASGAEAECEGIFMAVSYTHLTLPTN